MVLVTIVEAVVAFTLSAYSSSYNKIIGSALKLPNNSEGNFTKYDFLG